MSDIYEQFEKAFARTAAFVILRDGVPVGKAAIRYPADGAGRLWFYLHPYGSPMVRGSATGGGYDKATAAAYAAARLLESSDVTDGFRAALIADGGWSWQRWLDAAGFTVVQAV